MICHFFPILADMHSPLWCSGRNLASSSSPETGHVTLISVSSPRETPRYLRLPPCLLIASIPIRRPDSRVILPNVLHVEPRKPLDVNSSHKGYLPEARSTFRSAGPGRVRAAWSEPRGVRGAGPLLPRRACGRSDWRPRCTEIVTEGGERTGVVALGSGCVGVSSLLSKIG